MKTYREEPKPLIKTYRAYFSQNNSQTARSLVASHWHDVYEVLYIRRGYGKQRLNNETGDIRPGDVVIICPGDVHATEALSADGCDVDYVQFSVGLVYNAKENLQMLRSGIVCAENHSIKKIFDVLSRNRQDDRAGKELIATGLIYALCGYLVQTCVGESQTKRSDVIEAVCAYVEHAEDIRLETVAARFNYSPEHLSRRFHGEMGVSYRNWCDRVRMERAVSLMREECNTVGGVAERLGYSDESSFIRAFKRLYGITPSAYRRSGSLVGGDL